MKAKFIVLVAALGTTVVVFAQIDQQKTPEQQIEESLSALPESLRDDVTVEGFDESGNFLGHGPPLAIGQQRPGHEHERDQRGDMFHKCSPMGFWVAPD